MVKLVHGSDAQQLQVGSESEEGRAAGMGSRKCCRASVAVKAELLAVQNVQGLLIDLLTDIEDAEIGAGLGYLLAV